MIQRSVHRKKSVREKNKMEISTAEAQGKELKGRRYKLINIKINFHLRIKHWGRCSWNSMW